MPQLRYPYLAARFTDGDSYVKGCPAGYEPGEEPLSAEEAAQMGPAVKDIGMGPGIPGFFMLVIEFEDGTVRRFFASPGTCTLEIGDPEQVPDLVAPEQGLVGPDGTPVSR